MLPSSDILCVNKMQHSIKECCIFISIFYSNTILFILLTFYGIFKRFPHIIIMACDNKDCILPFRKNQPILNPADLLRFIGLQQIIPILLMLCQAFFCLITSALSFTAITTISSALCPSEE